MKKQIALKFESSIKSNGAADLKKGAALPDFDKGC